MNTLKDIIAPAIKAIVINKSCDYNLGSDTVEGTVSDLLERFEIGLSANAWTLDCDIKEWVEKCLSLRAMAKFDYF